MDLKDYAEMIASAPHGSTPMRQSLAKEYLRLLKEKDSVPKPKFPIFGIMGFVIGYMLLGFIILELIALIMT